MSDQMHGDIVGDDLVDEVGVVDRPAGLSLAERLAELALSWCVLPGLPDVCGELGVDVIRELVLELLLKRARVQLVEADLLLGLLHRRLRCIEDLVSLLSSCLLRLFSLRSCFFGIHPRTGLGQVVGVFEGRRAIACVVRLEHEEQRQACQRQHKRFLEGEHRGECAGLEGCAGK